MRGKKAPKRKLKPDARYNSVLVTKFINYLMSDGKKTTAEKVLYGCFDIIDKAIKDKKIDAEYETALQVFDQAVKNVAPQVEVRGKRVGGANYQVPYPVRGERKYTLTFRWIIEAASKKKGRPMRQKLAEELIAALSEEGDSMKKRSDVHRMAESNRAFAHFAR
ncbi:30S ribosomal protein S7 [Candidatus Falkowbacteria bacterium CG10_big_fil_rev_8_21_14_0_10_39_11]|uniref:Small ribosomal subunit protein uS7 n=1 Tax=Candidatus Falkowbacteria bacterium CG10_big_fil_rev_8_21_14_0_10_39_11 TaxID=1974565 RepID=A0A2H0V3P3_9BACT|nr:MAG: 30S ribosomal protein S7 [Candidatus Falkowbacteria bacterium CG10_big_fil_rev_8_21_14_0_10_39_11]